MTALRIETKTWNRDSHDLFDYEATHVSQNRYYINRNIKAYRENTEIHVIPETSSLPAPCDYLFSLKASKDGRYMLFPAERSQCNSATIIPKKLWTIVRDLREKHYELQENDVIKLGRFKLKVRQVCCNPPNSKTGQFPEIKLDDVDVPVLLATEEELKDAQCRICLMEGSTDDDPLICACECRGSIKFVHVKCLRLWMKGKNNFTEVQRSTYFFKQISCELCKSLFATAVNLSKDRVPIVQLPKTEPPFIVLENMNNQHGLHIISMADKKDLKLGRGHESDVRIPDVSISRYHATIRYSNDMFVLSDNDSKFGTLVAVRKAHIIGRDDTLSMQIGRSTVLLMIDDSVPSSAEIIDASDTLLKQMETPVPPEEPGGDSEPTNNQNNSFVISNNDHIHNTTQNINGYTLSGNENTGCQQLSRSDCMMGGQIERDGTMNGMIVHTTKCPINFGSKGREMNNFEPNPDGLIRSYFGRGEPVNSAVNSTVNSNSMNSNNMNSNNMNNNISQKKSGGFSTKLDLLYENIPDDDMERFRIKSNYEIRSNKIINSGNSFPRNIDFDLFYEKGVPEEKIPEGINQRIKKNYETRSNNKTNEPSSVISSNAGSESNTGKTKYEVTENYGIMSSVNKPFDNQNNLSNIVAEPRKGEEIFSDSSNPSAEHRNNIFIDHSDREGPIVKSHICDLTDIKNFNLENTNCGQAISKEFSVSNQDKRTPVIDGFHPLLYKKLNTSDPDVNCKFGSNNMSNSSFENTKSNKTRMNLIFNPDPYNTFPNNNVLYNQQVSDGTNDFSVDNSCQNNNNKYCFNKDCESSFTKNEHFYINRRVPIRESQINEKFIDNQKLIDERGEINERMNERMNERINERTSIIRNYNEGRNDRRNNEINKDSYNDLYDGDFFYDDQTDRNIYPRILKNHINSDLYMNFQNEFNNNVYVDQVGNNNNNNIFISNNNNGNRKVDIRTKFGYDNSNHELSKRDNSFVDCAMNLQGPRNVQGFMNPDETHDYGNKHGSDDTSFFFNFAKNFIQNRSQSGIIHDSSLVPVKHIDSNTMVFPEHTLSNDDHIHLQNKTVQNEGNSSSINGSSFVDLKNYASKTVNDENVRLNSLNNNSSQISNKHQINMLNTVRVYKPNASQGIFVPAGSRNTNNLIRNNGDQIFSKKTVQRGGSKNPNIPIFQQTFTSAGPSSVKHAFNNFFPNFI